MRLALLLTDAYGGYGGIASFNRTLLQAFSEIGQERGWPGGVVLALNDRADAAPAGGTFFRHAGFARDHRRFTAAAARLFWRSDLIFLGHANLLPLAFLGPARSWLVVHGIDAWRRLPLLHRCALIRMEKILSVSRFTQKIMAALNGVSSGRFSTFPNSVAGAPGDTRLQPSSPRLLAAPFILSVARLAATEGYKNLDLAIRAFAVVAASRPNLQYVIVGNGDDRNRLREVAVQSGVGARVLFVGAVADAQLDAYYRDCELFLLPSSKEGFGIVFLEAMRQAKPCIGASEGGIPEVVTHLKTGLLVNPRDITCVASAISQLLDNPGWAASLGAAGLQDFQARFSFPHFKRRLERLLPA